MQENPQEDWYVECSSCGHEIDFHDHNGCQAEDGASACTCELSWTREKEIREYYKKVGVPVLINTSEEGEV